MVCKSCRNTRKPLDMKSRSSDSCSNCKTSRKLLSELTGCILVYRHGNLNSRWLSLGLSVFITCSREKNGVCKLQLHKAWKHFLSWIVSWAAILMGTIAQGTRMTNAKPQQHYCTRKMDAAEQAVNSSFAQTTVSKALPETNSKRFTLHPGQSSTRAWSDRCQSFRGARQVQSLMCSLVSRAQQPSHPVDQLGSKHIPGRCNSSEDEQAKP
jgi:hypothetical protein